MYTPCGWYGVVAVRLPSRSDGGTRDSTGFGTAGVPDRLPARAGEGPPLPNEEAATSARDLPPGGVFTGGDRTRFTAGCLWGNVATACASSSNDTLLGFGGGLAGGTLSPAFAGQGGSGEGLACPV